MISETTGNGLFQFEAGTWLFHNVIENEDLKHWRYNDCSCEDLDHAIRMCWRATAMNIPVLTQTIIQSGRLRSVGLKHNRDHSGLMLQSMISPSSSRITM